MCVYIYICICVYVYTYIYICMYLFACIYSDTIPDLTVESPFS